MYRYFEYQFEWDPLKAHANFRKHGITFERAATVFMDSRALSLLDEEHSQNEERWVTLGLDQTGILILVCHTHLKEQERGAHVRIISARKASKNETRQYKEA